MERSHHRQHQNTIWHHSAWMDGWMDVYLHWHNVGGLRGVERMNPRSGLIFERPRWPSRNGRWIEITKHNDFSLRIQICSTECVLRVRLSHPIKNLTYYLQLTAFTGCIKGYPKVSRQLESLCFAVEGTRFNCAQEDPNTIYNHTTGHWHSPGNQQSY